MAESVFLAGSLSTYQQLHAATDHDLLQAYILGKEDRKARTPLGKLVSLINAVVWVSTQGSGKTKAPKKSFLKVMNCSQ
jgi:hypothetical protein